jgi:hypothetical protein
MLDYGNRTSEVTPPDFDYLNWFLFGGGKPFAAAALRKI